MTRPRPLLAVLLLAAGCGRRAEPLAAPEPTPPAAAQPEPPAPAAPADPPPPAGEPIGPRVKLRLGDGFLFDAARVTRRPADHPDLVFRYWAAQPGNSGVRFNVFTRQLEPHVQPRIDTDTPCLSAAKIAAFAADPRPPGFTVGDANGWPDSAVIAGRATHFVLRTHAGRHYLLQLTGLDAPHGRTKDWWVELAFTALDLPLGPAGGKAAPTATGTLCFHDAYRFKQVLAIDLGTGKYQKAWDGVWPHRHRSGELAFIDRTGAVAITDPAGTVTTTLRRKDGPASPVLSPDGTKVAVVVQGPSTAVIGGKEVVLGQCNTVKVLDRQNKEVASLPKTSDPAWTPDGRLVLSGHVYSDGLSLTDRDLKDPKPVSADLGRATEPCVSPDGQTVAFTMNGRVFLIGLDGTGLRQPVNSGEPQRRPCFSPDGKKLALLLGGDTFPPVHLVDLATGVPERFLGADGNPLTPSTTSRLSWTE